MAAQLPPHLVLTYTYFRTKAACGYNFSGDKSFDLFVDLILYVQSAIFQLYRDGSFWVEPVLSLDNVLAQGHNAVTPVRLKLAAPRSRVKHSTTEPLRSLVIKVKTFQSVIDVQCSYFPDQFNRTEQSM